MTLRGLVRSLIHDEGGFIFLIPVVLVLMGGTAITVYGGVSAANNADMIADANAGLASQMRDVQKATENSDDPRKQDANKKAKELESIATDMEQKARITKTLEIMNVPVSVAEDAGSAILGGPAKPFFAITSRLSYGKMAYQDVTAPSVDKDTQAYIDRINKPKFIATTRIIEKGGDAGYAAIDRNSAIEGAIIGAQIGFVQHKVETVTSAGGAKATKLAKEVLADSYGNRPPTVPRSELVGKADDYDSWLAASRSHAGEVSKMWEPSHPKMTTPQWKAEQDKTLGALQDGIAKSVAKVDPGKAKGAKGEIVLSPEDKAALKTGEKSSAIGTFISPMGAQPVVVTRKGRSAYTGTFPTLDQAPTVQSNKSFTVPKKKWQSWWDKSRQSCPFLLAWDGERFSAANDIISVSRDPQREYIDFMRFDAMPLRDGTFEARVSEIRGEESFLDLVRLWAIDVPDGFDAAVSPDGRAFSVANARPPVAVTGVSAAAVDAQDGTGLAAYDGAPMTATFDAPSKDAVLLVTVDGFERSPAGQGLPLAPPRRPAVLVEALVDGGWVTVGEVHPRENLDTAAFDVSPRVRNRRVTVRLTGVSCFSGVYQLVDRVALSTARSDLARLRPIATDVTAQIAPDASAPSTNAAELLGSKDGRRLHMMPGDSLRFSAPDPGADAFAVESVGWYRERAAPQAR
jgi:hypothetical protein